MEHVSSTNKPVNENRSHGVIIGKEETRLESCVLEERKEGTIQEKSAVKWKHKHLDTDNHDDFHNATSLMQSIDDTGFPIL